MNKQEAAALLGCSARQIERYVKDDRIGVKYERGKTRPTPVFDRGELEQFKRELEQPTYRPTVQRMEPRGEVATGSDIGTDNGSRELSPLRPDVATFLAAVIEKATTPATSSPVAVADKLLLTLPEAQQLTGLSRAALREAIRSGALAARQIGKAWRIKRLDLEAWINDL